MNRPRVALFVTCLIDSFRPQAGFAAARLLERADCEVFVPSQTCCGQPAYNGGNEKDAIALARKFIREFGDYDFVVTPSASCAGMIKNHYPILFETDAKWAPACATARREDARAFFVSRKHSRSEERRSDVRAKGRLSRFMFFVARSKVRARSPRITFNGQRPGCRRYSRRGNLLRIWRAFLRQIPRNLCAHGGR